MAQPRETQTCKFVFTINNVPDDHPVYNALLEEHVCCPDSHDDRFFQYICVAPEIAPTTGTPHCQGYCFTKKPVRVTQVVKKFNDIGFSGHQHPFVDKAVSSHETNFNYVSGLCEKKGMVMNPKFKEFGVRPSFESTSERQKKDYKVTRDLAMQGKFLEINPQHFICHYRALVGIADRYVQPPADLTETCGIWIWGAPGTGKSYLARTSEELYGDTVSRFYVKNSNKWFCGFRSEDHDRMILDDFEIGAGASLGHYLKIWADVYAFQGEIKGGSAFIRPKSFTVTSNYHPLEIFGNSADSAGPMNNGGESMAHAILRRFRVYKMTLDGDTRTVTYEPLTGTLRFKLPVSTGTVPSFNLPAVEVSIDQTRTFVIDTPEQLATPNFSVATSSGGSTVIAPQEKSTAGTNFRTPEAPRNRALMEYMQDRNVPTAGTQPLEEEEEADESDNEDDAEKADFVDALLGIPNEKPTPVVGLKDDIVDLTADSDEEKKAVKPKLTRSTTIYAVRDTPAQSVEDCKRARNLV